MSADNDDRELLHVSFCCNDASGIFNGECAGVQIEDADGELVMSFIQMDVPMRWEVASFILDSEEFSCGPRTPWKGSLFWDETRMTAADTEWLVRWLIANAGSPAQWKSEHPIGRLAETEVHAA